MADEPLSNYTRDIFLQLSGAKDPTPDDVEFIIQGGIEKAVAAERERCAKIADGFADRLNAARTTQGLRGGEPNAYESAAKQIAAAIRDPQEATQ